MERGLILLLLPGIVLCTVEQSMIVNVGERVMLPCRVVGSGTKDSISWFRNEERITLGTYVIKDKQRLDINKAAQNEWNLVIRNIRESDEARYVCRTDKDREISIVQLRIETKPEVVEPQSSSQSETAQEDSRLELKCVVRGEPEPLVTWFRKAKAGDYPMFPVGVVGPILTLPEVSRYASDLYICYANNTHGKIYWTIDVTINFFPEVTVYETEIEADIRENVVMSCLIQASPLEGAYWTSPDNKKVKDNWKYEVVQEEEEGYPILYLTMMIRRSMWDSRDYGIYTCHCGGARATVLLKERQPKTTQKVIRYQ